MSLFADYKLEREGKRCLENDHGFVTFQVTGDECYIEDIYVVPKYRRDGVGTELADQVAVFAKANGCKRLLASCVPTANGSTNSMKAILSYGFRLHSCRENFIILVKEIV